MIKFNNKLFLQKNYPRTGTHTQIVCKVLKFRDASLFSEKNISFDSIMGQIYRKCDF